MNEERVYGVVGDSPRIQDQEMLNIDVDVHYGSLSQKTCALENARPYMTYVIAPLCAALCLSISDLCSNYALSNGLTNIRHCFWSHGVVYALALAFGIWFVSEKGQLATNISFPENKMVGLSSVLAGCFGFAALVLINYAFKSNSKNNIGYVVAVLSTTSVITLLLAVALFDKPVQWRGAFGVCFTLIGVLLISGCGNDR